MPLITNEIRVGITTVRFSEFIDFGTNVNFIVKL